MRLADLSASAYAEQILPLTATLWAGRRDFDTYVAQSLAIARSAYGRRNFATLGLYDGAQLVASMKRYTRHIRFGALSLRALGIGAVFTPAPLRGRGYASVMLSMLLDRARRDGYDLAFLFSDIRPHFYHEIGFATLPSRTISLRADTLPHQRLSLDACADGDWSGIRRCFDANARERAWSFTRPPLVWEWLALRMRQGSEHPIGSAANLVARRGRRIVAYVFGVRAPERDAYLLDEFGYLDPEAAALIPALLRSAAGDLRRITGWLPPSGAREQLPHGSIRKRTTAIAMAAPLTPLARTWLATAQQPTPSDGIWANEHI